MALGDMGRRISDSSKEHLGMTKLIIPQYSEKVKGERHIFVTFTFRYEFWECKVDFSFGT